jgi:hypothetical protein
MSEMVDILPCKSDLRCQATTSGGMEKLLGKRAHARWRIQQLTLYFPQLRIEYAP